MTLTTRLDWDGVAVTADMRAAAVDGLKLGAEHLLGESRKEVPLEEGVLERSGVATVDAASLTAAVSYDTPYAVPQHEELDWRHDEGRKAKYLEDPAAREAPVIGEIVAAAIRRKLT